MARIAYKLQSIICGKSLDMDAESIIISVIAVLSIHVVTSISV